MNKATRERINILAGVSTIEFFVRSKAMDMVDSISKIHPMIKLYFDSELGSEIESNTLLAMSEALIWSVEAFTGKESMSKFHSIGVCIAQTLSKNMYFAKLIHQANTGRITAEQFYELAAEYISAESVNVINQLWDAVGADLPKYLSAGIQKVLESLGVNFQMAEWIAGLVDSVTDVVYSYVKKFLTQEKIQEFVYTALKFSFKAARNLSIGVDNTVEKVKDFYHNVENKVKSWGRNIFKYFNWIIPDFLKDTGTTIELNDPNNELRISIGASNKQGYIYEPVTIDIDKPDINI